MTNEIIIKPFDGDQLIADTVAARHLGIRIQQRKDGESEFRTNLYASQSDLRAIDTYYIEPGGNFFIAWDAPVGEIAGFIGLKKCGEAEGQIKRMAVLPAYRRQRIGTRLAETVIEWAVGSGFKTLRLTTGKNENAIDIYKTVGFVVTGYDQEHNDHLMTLDLIS